MKRYAIYPRNLATLFVFASVVIVLLQIYQIRGEPSALGKSINDSAEIETIVPAPPYCLFRNSPYPFERRLELHGQDFPILEHQLEFRNANTLEPSIQINMEVDWESTKHIRVDMGRIKDLLWSEPKLPLQVRITGAEYVPLSDWSPVFYLADDAATCGLPRLEPTPNPLPERGRAGDFWADVVLGQPDFTEITPYQVVPWKVFNPGGVTVDRSVSPGRAYIWDSGNSRILGIDLSTCYSGESPCSASIVLGQPSANRHSACNGDSGFQRYPMRATAGPNTLCGILEDTLSPLENKSYVNMAVSWQGDLFVPDVFNHRVLKYSQPFETDTIADSLWGQSTFQGNECNQGRWGPYGEPLPEANTLCQPEGVELDFVGNLWVADSGNNRVLRFPINSESGVISPTPDLVIGQPDFTTGNYGTDMRQFNRPTAVRVRSNSWLYVSDTENNRVLLFKPPFTNGMAAEDTFGYGLSNPWGLDVDPGNQGLWINDHGNQMVELWDWDGETVKKVLGRDSFPPDTDVSSIISDSSGGGLGIDTTGNVLVSVYVYGQDVYRFASPIPVPTPGQVYQPDRYLFSPPGGYNAYSPDEFRQGQSVATCGDQLVVSDGTRLMYWNDLRRLTNGKPPDGILGVTQESFFPEFGSWISTTNDCKLWFIRTNGSIDIYNMPLHSDSHPTRIFEPGQSIDVLGGGSLTMNIAISSVVVPIGNSDFIWVSEPNNHRVYRIRQPLVLPQVDVILGQTNPEGILCNRGLIPPPNTGTDLKASLDMLCFPSTLSIDRLGNLYVSDHAPEVEGNWRMLLFPKGIFTNNLTTALYAPAASKAFPAMLWQAAFDLNNRMFAGYNPYVNGRFVGVYSDPTSDGVLPSEYLKDFGSWQHAVTFDRYHNLYVADGNRNRVLIYWNPSDLPLPIDLLLHLPIVIR
jgi:hypothetical protein